MIGLLLCSKRYCLEALAATEFIGISLGRRVKMWSSFPKLISFGSTKRPAYPECGDRVISRNVGKSSHLDMAVCPRKYRMGGVNEVVTDALVAWHHSQIVQCLRCACVCVKRPLNISSMLTSCENSHRTCFVPVVYWACAQCRQNVNYSVAKLHQSESP